MPWGTPVLGSIFFAARAKMRRRLHGKRRLDFDGVECFTCFAPLIPLQPVHVWNWGHDETTGHAFSIRRVTTYSFRSMPIRWSRVLLLRALLKVWLWLPIVIGLMFSLSCTHGIIFRMAAFGLFSVSLIAWLALFLTDLGEADVRRLLGRHRLGVSDPATWTPDLVGLLAPAPEWFGTATFAESVDVLLEQRRYGEAMWAARLCLAVEDEARGRALTERVRWHPETRAVLAQLKSRRAGFKELVNWQDARPFPLLRPERGRAAAFWRSMIADRTKQTLTNVTYWHNVAGMAAAAFDTDEFDDDTRDDPKPPRGQLGPQSPLYRLAGIGLIGAILAASVTFCGCSSLFREKTPFEIEIEQERRRIEEEHRRIARQHAAALPPAPAADPPKPAAPPRWAVREPGDWRYLAEMPAFDVRDGEWKFTSDGTIGNPDRTPIKVGDVPSPRGLGMHPHAFDFMAAKYRLGGQARIFKAAGALDDSIIVPHGPLVFEVWGDGKMLWQSEPLTARSQFKECEVNVEGVEVLELRAIARGGNYHVHGVWLEPRVLRK